ncbi:adhesion G protein-coupled receptor G3 [Trichosurus vulpecula]|uniref:adhesion G protein-coupled receptor G3 n=1 Tax=Trichosurus vulpecula TaxID=9337 RepID=UPI00186B11E2|nr:adhesion G protein-coupled receptor G3 [Trichosurus vulpecula]
MKNDHGALHSSDRHWERSVWVSYGERTRLRPVTVASPSRHTPTDLGTMLLQLLLLLQLDPVRAKEKEKNYCSGEAPDPSQYAAARCFTSCTRSTPKCKPEVIERFWIKKFDELSKEKSPAPVLDETAVKATIHNVSVNISQDLFFSISPSQVPASLNGNEMDAPDRVRLPRSLFESLRRPNMTSVRVILAVINIGEGDIFKGSATGQRFSSSVLDNRMVGIQVGTEPTKNLSEPVEIIFSHQQQDQKLQCVFWDDSKGTTGDWKPTGCSTEQRTNQTICLCDHLTFFALLLKPVLDAATVKALIQISLAGCGTSLCFLFLAIIFYFALRFTKQRFKSEDAPKIHVALSISLVLLNLTFIIMLGNNSPEQGTSCRAQGGIFHYFLLCCFTWMGIEALHLYLLAIKIFNTYISHYFLKLCLVGWGLPILVVFITGIIGSYGRYTIKDGANHTTLELCWIEDKTALHITVHGYFIVTFLFGGVVLGLVAWKIFHLRGSKAGKEQNQTWKGVITVLGLSCLVGGTWGLVLLNPIGLTAIYAFTLLNSLQGVFMFSWFAILFYPSLKEESASSTAKSSNSASRE